MDIFPTGRLLLDLKVSIQIVHSPGECQPRSGVNGHEVAVAACRHAQGRAEKGGIERDAQETKRDHGRTGLKNAARAQRAFYNPRKDLRFDSGGRGHLPDPTFSKEASPRRGW